MYVTENQLRSQIVEALKAKRRAPDGTVDVTQVQSELADPKYEQWIAARIEEARQARRLLTPQQMDDFAQKRVLRTGDRVRYIGPQRLEQSPKTGRHILRKAGQTGVIANVANDQNRAVYTFLPDVNEDLRALAESQDVEVLALVTSAWIDFERIPS